MNLGGSAKYLCNQNEDVLQPINTQFSGIFNKASKIFTQENLSLLNNRNRKSPQLSESSNSTVETIDYEFLTPHSKTKVVRHHVTSSPIKELNLSEYFGAFMEKPKLLQNLDQRQTEILRRISKNVPADGNITFKTNAANEIEIVSYYNPFKSKAMHFNMMTPSQLGLLEKTLVCQPSTSQQPQVQAPSKTVPVKRKVGRPRNDSKRPVEKEIDPFEEDDLVSHRTKSGRIVKLNPEIAKIFQSEPMPIAGPSQPQSLVQPLAHNPVVETLPVQTEPKLLPGLAEPPKKTRKISSEFRCTTCKKIYLGKNKMNNHFKLFPDHRPKVSETDSVLFTHLMTMVRQKKKSQDMIDVFFKEISNFVHCCEKLTPRLITNKDNHPNTHPHIVDKNAASLLRINPGNYRLNMNVFDKNFKLDNPIEEPPPEEPEEPEAVLDSSDNHDDHPDEIHQPAPLVNGNEIIKALDAINVPSLDGNEVNLLIRQTNELTNLTNISDIVGETEKIDDDNALLGF